MDNIKELITKAVKQMMTDESLRKLFEKDPVKALEKIFNVDLPDEILNPVIDGIKAQLTVEKLGDAAGFLKKLF